MVRKMNKNIKWIVGFGILIWLIPFLASFPIIELRESNRPLFESIMPVVLTIIVEIFTILYFFKVEKNYFYEGIIAGIIWFVICIIVDLIMFLPESPMQMSFVDYMMDIGLTYLIIVFIPIGTGYLLEKKTS